MCLGTDYTYKTDLYVDGEMCDSVLQGQLIVRGGFDPMFSQADIQIFIDSLRSLGVDSIDGDVILDLSMKDTLRLGWGWCWDDKAISLTPLLCDGRDAFANTFYTQLEAAGISLSGQICEGRVPDTAVLRARVFHGIKQILHPMMKQSNNNYAESMFYQLAANGGQPYAGRRQAAQEVGKIIEQMQLDPSHYVVADGSGLSLYNYITAQVLLRFLREAYSRPAIYEELCASLPIAGNDGTLQDRLRQGNACFNVRAKTGTLMGVSSLAGYCTAANGNRLCFVIFNNGVRRQQSARDFQDKVCEALTASMPAPVSDDMESEIP